jgi:hypothetical protein
VKSRNFSLVLLKRVIFNILRLYIFLD